MKKHIMMALALALTPALATAADFSGAWVRDAAKSDPASFPIYWITRAPPAGGGGGGQAVVEIKQTGNTVQITDPARRLRTYTLDGQSRTERMETGLANATVSATTQGDAMVVTSNQPYGGMPGNVPSTFKDTWSLSPDGKVLTITTVRTSPGGAQTSKQVYNKR